MKLGRLQLRIDPVVFFTPAALIVAFVIFGAVDQVVEEMKGRLDWRRPARPRSRQRND